MQFEYLACLTDDPVALQYMVGVIYTDDMQISSYGHSLRKGQLLHCIYGPATIWYYANGKAWRRSYHIKMLYHRACGPALMLNDTSDNIYYAAYYLDDVLTYEREFN
jgi:hypothetical protein